MQRRKWLLSALIYSLLLQVLPSSSAAGPTIAFNGLMTTCNILFSSNNIYVNRFVANKAITITGLNINVGTSANTNWATTVYYLFSNNTSTNAPGNNLATFTSDRTSGTGGNTVVHFTGSYSLAQGTKFFLVPSVSYSTFPVCYSNSPPTADLFPNNGINVDTSTSLTNSSWHKAYVAGGLPAPNSTWTVNFSAPQIWQLSIESGVLVAMSVSLALADGSSFATYRSPSTINATVNTASTVTFTQNGKKIPNCINVASSAGVATCSWRPSQRGANTLSAIAKPTGGGYLQGSAEGLRVLVTNRSNSR